MSRLGDSLVVEEPKAHARGAKRAVGWQSFWGKARRACGYLKAAVDGISLWLLSLVATLVIPAIPIAIEFVKTGDVKNETILISRP